MIENKIAKKNGLLSAQVRAVGEHYVMARLTALGFIVGLAPENTRAVDIVAMSEDGKRNFQIQVKTMTKGRSSDQGWYMHPKHEEIRTSNLFYVFVALPQEWTDKDQPETFIIPSAKVAEVLKQSHKEWLATPGAKGQKHNDSNVRRLLPKYKHSQAIPSDWMEEYRNNWSVLC
jgi:hypothetical protein